MSNNNHLLNQAPKHTKGQYLADAMERRGWQFVPTSPEEWCYLKFNEKGHIIDRERSDGFKRDLEKAKKEVGDFNHAYSLNFEVNHAPENDLAGSASLVFQGEVKEPSCVSSLVF